MNKAPLAPRIVALTAALALLLGSFTTILCQDRDLKLSQTTSQTNGRRIALVIGNADYATSPLKNPANDATDMAAALSKLGFTVEHGANLTQRQMKAMIREFGQKLKAGGQGLFYFAGHGVQLKGKNYLIPVDVEIASEADVEDQGVDANLVMSLMDEAGNGLNVVILDACRNNPFARSFRSAANGLAQVDAPTGTLIAYATAPGRVARDGKGRNGTYTAELLKQMTVPGLPIEELLKKVRGNVRQQTNGEQVPWESSSLVGDFYLNRPVTVSARPADRLSDGAAVAANPAAVEQEYWESIRNSTDPADFRDYLKEYPTGAHAVIARSNLRRLEAAAANKMGNATPSNAGGAGSVPNAGSASRPSASKPSAVVRNQVGLELVLIPPGSFIMGGEGLLDTRPIHQVTIREGFYIGRYEITQAQWQHVMGNNPSQFRKGSNPVENVSWDDASDFINRLNEMNDGYSYRLPTEAEWEYACRAGTTGDYAGDVNKMSWYEDNSGARTHAVGQKQPNAFGLYDMHGNVWEWCLDYWHENYGDAPSDGSAWLTGGNSRERVVRSGSWNNNYKWVSSFFRYAMPPTVRGNNVGFRVVAVAR